MAGPHGHGPTACYVANLPHDVRLSEIEDFFHNYPDSPCKVQDVSFKKGYVFVELSNESHVEDAVKNLHGTTLKNKLITVQKSLGNGAGEGYRGNARDSRPQRTKFGIIVSNLDSNIGWNDLKIIGRKYGEVTFADANNTRKGESWRGKGILTYAAKADMKIAYNALRDYELDGRLLEVEYEFPEVLEDGWDGDINNDFPDYYRDKDGNQGRRSPRLGRRTPPSKRGRSLRSRSRSPYGRRSSLSPRRGDRRGLASPPPSRRLRRMNSRDRSPYGRSRSPYDRRGSGFTDRRGRSRTPPRIREREASLERRRRAERERDMLERERNLRLDEDRDRKLRDYDRRDERLRLEDRRAEERRLDDRRLDDRRAEEDRRRDRYDSFSERRDIRNASPLRNGRHPEDSLNSVNSVKRETDTDGPVIKQIVELLVWVGQTLRYTAVNAT